MIQLPELHFCAASSMHSSLIPSPEHAQFRGIIIPLLYFLLPMPICPALSIGSTQITTLVKSAWRPHRSNGVHVPRAELIMLACEIDPPLKLIILAIGAQSRLLAALDMPC